MKPSCDPIRANLSAWLDGEVGAEEARRIEDHLAVCEGCRREREALTRTRALLAGAGRLRAPEPWVREAVRRAAGRRVERPSAIRSLSRPWAISSLAAAAALVVVLVSVRLIVGEREMRPEIAAPVARQDAKKQDAMKDETPTGAVHLPEPSAEPPTAPPPAKAGPRQATGPSPAPASVKPAEPDMTFANPEVTEEIDVIQAGPAAAPPATVPEEEKTTGEAVAAAESLQVVGAKGEATGLLEAAAPPTLRVTLAQIRFPIGEQDQIADRPGEARLRAATPRPVSAVGGAPATAPPPQGLPAGAKGPPAAPSGREKKAELPGAPEPRILRVRVLLDAASRVLAAHPLDPPLDAQAALLIDRLRGAAIETQPPLVEAGSAAREVILEIALEGGPAP